MAISFNSAVDINSSKLWDKHQIGSRSLSGASMVKSANSHLPAAFGSRRLEKGRRGLGLCLWSANTSDRLTTETSTEKGPANSEISFPIDQTCAENLRVRSSGLDDSNLKETSSAAKPKRSSLTARERLRAARVLSRYNETKPSKSDMGKVLDAIKESERGKKKGLPEAPGNLFDDSNRGLSKPGFNFEFPGGNDLFIIVFSFVFISTVMFATTYIVWKVGAIHFNEY